ncbi:ribonuclease HI [Elysia marginata]|uniref:Ribonuclease HI n=1 Tax=Elysia marginata TaxID=1093978 RepID=A0AAV4H1P3_9GAST|nr:ribonuclease HI [Elysia marginata]
MLQHLPPACTDFFLKMFEALFTRKKGTIIPIQKSGKDPSQMASYQPIQLSSCTEESPDRVEVSLFADNLAILASSDDLTEAEALIQEALTSLRSGIRAGK